MSDTRTPPALMSDDEITAVEAMLAATTGGADGFKAMLLSRVRAGEPVIVDVTRKGASPCYYLIRDEGDMPQDGHWFDGRWDLFAYPAPPVIHEGPPSLEALALVWPLDARPLWAASRGPDGSLYLRYTDTISEFFWDREYRAMTFLWIREPDTDVALFQHRRQKLATREEET